jgi:hypothetical protein
MVRFALHSAGTQLNHVVMRHQDCFAPQHASRLPHASPAVLSWLLPSGCNRCMPEIRFLIDRCIKNAMLPSPKAQSSWDFRYDRCCILFANLNIASRPPAFIAWFLQSSMDLPRFPSLRPSCVTALTSASFQPCWCHTPLTLSPPSDISAHHPSVSLGLFPAQSGSLTQKSVAVSPLLSRRPLLPLLPLRSAASATSLLLFATVCPAVHLQRVTPNQATHSSPSGGGLAHQQVSRLDSLPHTLSPSSQ